MKYLSIVAWGRFTASSNDYIAAQLDKAKADNAPATAIYKREGRWYTLDDISDEGTKTRVGNIMATLAQEIEERNIGLTYTGLSYGEDGRIKP